MGEWGFFAVLCNTQASREMSDYFKIRISHSMQRISIILD